MVGGASLFAEGARHRPGEVVHRDDSPAAERLRHAQAGRARACGRIEEDDAAVESIVFGEAGIINSLRKGAIHISSSTISVALSDKLAAAHAEKEERFVSAPVFGRPEAAAAAKLFITVAGRT